jgi:hypothetical protein
LSSVDKLICPTDKRKPSTGFQWLQNSNISYFVGLDADETKPQSLLAGDRFMSSDDAPKMGVITLQTNSDIRWSGELHRSVESFRSRFFDHRNVGFAGLADGSVSIMDDFELRNRASENVRVYGTQRLEFPQSDWPPKR